jgi:hypothetical protein
MGTHQICPKLSHTSGHIVRVSVQIIDCLQSREIFGGLSGKYAQVHFHPLCERRHQPLNPPPVVRREVQEQPETLIQSFEQHPFGRMLLKRPDRLLDILNLSPDDLVADELPLELAEKIQAAMPVDQIRIGDRIGGTGKEIGQADLVANIGRHDGQRRIKQPRHLLEKIAEEFLFG